MPSSSSTFYLLFFVNIYSSSAFSDSTDSAESSTFWMFFSLSLSSFKLSFSVLLISLSPFFISFISFSSLANLPSSILYVKSLFLRLKECCMVLSADLWIFAGLLGECFFILDPWILPIAERLALPSPFIFLTLIGVEVADEARFKSIDLHFPMLLLPESTAVHFCLIYLQKLIIVCLLCCKRSIFFLNSSSKN